MQDGTLHGRRGDALQSRATHATKLQMTCALQLAALQSFACAAASKRGCFFRACHAEAGATIATDPPLNQEYRHETPF
ncbi:hypothetical protein [Xanthomonas sp. SHU 308]|uniref:hypothetical protein n=1 Tax=Xanthomonas sp. SHU 308 TaxID=1591201 RepID=UPI0012FF212D|nr:hypothetical protein [Xanthomonas sp. SHU 308]